MFSVQLVTEKEEKIMIVFSNLQITIVGRNFIAQSNYDFMSKFRVIQNFLCSFFVGLPISMVKTNTCMGSIRPPFIKRQTFCAFLWSNTLMLKLAQERSVFNILFNIFNYFLNPLKGQLEKIQCYLYMASLYCKM